MGNANLNRIYENLAASGTDPQVHIQQHLKVSPNLFKVIAATHGVSNEADFAEAIATVTNGKGRVIPGSFNSKSTSSGNLCVAFITANAQSQPMDASFHMLTASTAVAADGSIWSVVDDGGNKRVVQESCDDLAAILATRQARRAIHANPVEGAGLATASFGNGDLVRYVDTASRKARWGIAFHTDAGTSVVTRSGGDTTPVVIESAAVVSSVPRSKLPADQQSKVQATAKLDPKLFDREYTYLKKAWAPGPMADAMFERYRKLASQSK